MLSLSVLLKLNPFTMCTVQQPRTTVAFYVFEAYHLGISPFS